MTADEVNKIIAEFMEHKCCYNCKHQIEDPQPGGMSSHYSCDNADDGFYIGDPCSNFEADSYPRYASSLDALVPAWKKLQTWHGDYSIHDECYSFSLTYYGDCSLDTRIFKGLAKTIQEAAAIATAKAIQELGG